ncbi:loricrin-like [Drosophila takahashii]|uniref:loricrin-like n=1 Tax=Drosophila takahashii TaxID=29030 RepID=UPI003898F66E
MVRPSILCIILGLYRVQALFCGNSQDKECVARSLCRVDSETGTPIIQFRSLSDGNNGCPAAETCCPITEITQFPIINQGAHQPIQGCGNVNRNGLTFTIANSGDTAQEGELPWMVVLLDAQYVQPIGGGSLIAPDVVLTTASVIRNLAENQFIVRAGEWDLHTNTEQQKHEDVFIRKIVRHSGFNEANGANNVALLFLARPLQLSRHINLICLPPANWRFSWNRCIVSGWGKKNLNAISYMNLLKKIEVPLVDSATCEQQLKGPYTSAFQLDSSLICAGGEAGKDSCEGDGGAPLACPIQGDPTRYEQVGIVNFGAGCGDPIAAAYTDVSKMKPWIDYQIQLNSVAGQGKDNGGYSTTGFQGQGKGTIGNSQYEPNGYQGPGQGQGQDNSGNDPRGHQGGVRGSQAQGQDQGALGNNRYDQNGFQGSPLGGGIGASGINKYDPYQGQGIQGGVGGGGAPVASGFQGPAQGQGQGPIANNGYGQSGYQGYLQGGGATVGSNVYDANRFQGQNTGTGLDPGGQLGVGGGGYQAQGQDQTTLGNNRFDQNGYQGSVQGQGQGTIGNTGNHLGVYPGPVQVGGGGYQAPVQGTIASSGNGYPMQGTGTGYYPGRYQGGLPGGVGGGGLPGPVLVSEVSHGTGGDRYSAQGGVLMGNNGNGLGGYQGGLQGGGRMGANGNNNNYQGQGIQGGLGAGGLGLGGGSGYDRDRTGLGNNYNSGGGHTFVSDEHKARENPNEHNIVQFDISTTTTTEGTPVAMEIELA